jgi:hypothetical protein
MYLQRLVTAGERYWDSRKMMNCRGGWPEYINLYMNSDTTNKFPDSIFAASHLTVRAIENSDGKSAESDGGICPPRGKVRNGFVRVRQKDWTIKLSWKKQQHDLLIMALNGS